MFNGLVSGNIFKKPSYFIGKPWFPVSIFPQTNPLSCGHLFKFPNVPFAMPACAMRRRHYDGVRHSLRISMALQSRKYPWRSTEANYIELLLTGFLLVTSMQVRRKSQWDPMVGSNGGNLNVLIFKGQDT